MKVTEGTAEPSVAEAAMDSVRTPNLFKGVEGTKSELGPIDQGS